MERRKSKVAAVCTAVWISLPPGNDMDIQQEVEQRLRTVYGV